MKQTLLMTALQFSDIVITVTGFVLTTLLVIIGFGIKEFISEVKKLKESLENMLIENSGFTATCRINTKVTDAKLEDHEGRIKENTKNINDHSERIGKVESKLKQK